MPRRSINRTGQEMTIGFRIKRSWTRIGADIAAKFREIPVANVSDCMARMTAGGPKLRPMHASGVMAGPAFTVKSRPGDNLMLHKAIDLAAPGDIIVCDAGGDLTNSLMGEMMLAHAIKRGIGGFVLNGSIRDRDAFIDRNLPVFAAGVTHRGPYKDGPGEIGYPIACGGQVVMPGDLICCDEDGVVVVPMAEAAAVMAAAEAHQAKEIQSEKDIQAGSWARDWVLASLREKGCEGA